MLKESEVKFKLKDFSEILFFFKYLDKIKINYK